MAVAVNVTGAVEIMVQETIGVSELKTLGYSEDMANIEERAFWHNVPGDQMGGPQGPPIEVQYLGAIAVIQIQMSKWDSAIWDSLRKRKVNATLGTVVDTEVGSLMLNNNEFRLLLKSPTRPLNFPTCILREAMTFAMGTKYTSAIMQVEAHITPFGSAVREGILHDTDTAEYV